MTITEVKNHCKLFKEKFERFDDKNKILISSKIVTKTAGKPGLHFNNWIKFKSRSYFILKIYLNGDISLIKTFSETDYISCKKYGLKTKYNYLNDE